MLRSVDNNDATTPRKDRYTKKHFQLSLSDKRQVESFVDLRNGVNYADMNDTKFCILRLRKEDAGIAADKMVQKGNMFYRPCHDC